MVNFFEFIAEEVREYLARLGFRSLAEIVGRVDLLDTALAVEHWKASGLDLSPVLYAPELPEGTAIRCVTGQDHGLEKALDNTLIQLAEGALADGRPVRLELPIRNVNRTVGTMLGYEVTKRWGGRRAARQHHRHLLHRVSRAVVRGVPAARHHAAAVRRRERLPGQGAVRRPASSSGLRLRPRSRPRNRSSRAT